MALSDYDKEMLALLDGRVKHLPNVKAGLNKSQIDRKAIDAYIEATTGIISDPDRLGDNVVESRAVANLAASKITTGTLSASTSITAGGTVISDTGIRLQDSANIEGSFPDDNTADWITPLTTGGSPNPFAGLGFFQDTPNDTRGVLIRASGVNAGSRKARVIISADNGNQDITSSTAARIRLESSNSTGAVVIKGQTQLNAPTSVVPMTGAFLNSGTISPGSAWNNSSGLKAFRFDKMVILQGRVDSQAGGTSSSNTICTLPADFRPTFFSYQVAACQNASSSVWDAQRRVVIEDSGQVHMAAGETMVGNRTLSLDGLTFFLD
jgi:hypothetical protein